MALHLNLIESSKLSNIAPLLSIQYEYNQICTRIEAENNFLLIKVFLTMFASKCNSGTAGLIPSWSRFIVKKTLGSSWSSAAIDAACSHLLKYHTMQNMLFMAKTEFQKFSEEPDWDFLRVPSNCIFIWH